MPIIRSLSTAVAASCLPLERDGSSVVGRGRSGSPTERKLRDWCIWLVDLFENIWYLCRVLCNNCRKLRPFSRKPAVILKLQFPAYIPNSFNNSLSPTSSFLYVWNNYSPSTSIKIAFLLPLLVLPFIAHLFFVLDSALSLYFIQCELEKLQRPLNWQLATSLCHPVELWLPFPAFMQGVETGRLEGGTLSH